VIIVLSKKVTFPWFLILISVRVANYMAKYGALEL